MGRLDHRVCSFLCGLALAAGFAQAGERLGYRPALSIGPLERCGSAVRRGERVWLGCATGLLLVAPGRVARAWPCGAEEPRLLEVVALGPGPKMAAAATPCGLVWLADDGQVLVEPLEEAPLVLAADGRGGAWALLPDALWRCAPEAGCQREFDLGDLDLEGVQLLGLGDGALVVLPDRVLRPDPTLREVRPPWPEAQPVVGPDGGLCWLDPEGRLLCTAAPGGSPAWSRIPVRDTGRRLQASSLHGLLWLSDGREYVAWAGSGWARGPLPPGLGVPVPVAGELEGGLPWLLLGSEVHRPARLGRAPLPWCPPPPEARPMEAESPPAPDPGATAWWPRLALVLSGHRRQRSGLGADELERQVVARGFGFGLSLAYPLDRLARTGTEAERAALERSSRVERAERIRQQEELRSARARLCQAERDSWSHQELEIIDQLLAILGSDARTP